MNSGSQPARFTNLEGNKLLTATKNNNNITKCESRAPELVDGVFEYGHDPSDSMKVERFLTT